MLMLLLCTPGLSIHMQSACYCVGAYKWDIVVVIKLGTYIHRVLAFYRDPYYQCTFQVAYFWSHSHILFPILIPQPLAH